jgi:hypothetical protein
MKALQQRSAEDGLNFHRSTKARVYSEDDVQKERIERSRKMVDACVAGRSGLRIVELGCGTLDISGPFSTQHVVYGVECNPEAARIASERWPHAHVNVISLQPEACDVLVLCEFLEHIPDPCELVKAWLPLAKQVVISHPLNGDLTGDLSGGEHQWSFNEGDFANWFWLGGHELVGYEVFTMSDYQIILGRGRRVA